MNQQFKKIFSVAFALLVGLGIVFFAWRVGSSTSNNVSFEPTISGDSWKGSLLAIQHASSTKILADASGALGAVATTTSDIIAREMLTNYALLARSNATTTLSDAEAQALAQGLVDKIGIIQEKQYTVRDLNVSADNSPEALTGYSNEIIKIAKIFIASHTKSDLEIALMDPRTDPSAKSTALEQNSAQYEKFIRAMLGTKTPSEIAPLHMRIIQTYSNIDASVQSLAGVYTDPIRGLAALDQYQKEIADLAALIKEYSGYFSKKK